MGFFFHWLYQTINVSVDVENHWVCTSRAQITFATHRTESLVAVALIGKHIYTLPSRILFSFHPRTVSPLLLLHLHHFTPRRYSNLINYVYTATNSYRCLAPANWSRAWILLLSSTRVPKRVRVCNLYRCTDCEFVSEVVL